jgi:hypothetical protein
MAIVSAALTVGIVAPPPAVAGDGITFARAVNYPTGSEFGPFAAPVGAVAADVDRDGDADVVVADPFEDGPLLMSNRGDGTFGRAMRIEVGSGIGSLDAADLNRDGLPDLVARTGSEVLSLLGDGTGRFTVADVHEMPVGAQQQAIAVNANRDRKLDIVTTTPLGIQVLDGVGDGTFEPGPFTSLSGMLSDVTAARFDGDRDRDLAVIDAKPFLQRVVALRGRGDGTFAETGSGSVGPGPEAVVSGKLDGDGLSDVVTADSFGFTASVLLADGRGGFNSAVNHPVGNGPVSAAVEDLDGDEDLDAVVSVVGDARLVVFAGSGDGRLVEVGPFPVTDYPQTPVVADLDRDGRPDLAVAGPGALSVLLNTTRRAR